MRLAFGIFLMLHGFAHLVGFVVPWRLMSNAEMPYKTTLLAGHWDVGDLGIRVNGLLWLALAIAFALVGVSVMRQTSGWQTAAWVVSIVSLLACVVSWPEARIGVFVNVAVIVVLLLGSKLGFLPGA